MTFPAFVALALLVPCSPLVMDQQPADLWLSSLILLLVAASIAAWFALFSRWRQRGVLLEYEVRPSVPWGVVVAMVPVVFVAVTLLASPGTEAPAEAERAATPIEVIVRLASLIFTLCLLVGSVLFVVAVLYRPTLRDVGLPTFIDELARDVGLGIVACVAALLPVYGIQVIVLFLFGQSRHPLVEMVSVGEPNLTVIILATIAAVIVAPVSEEILFRLLLQGWLEKWEDRRLGWRRAAAVDLPAVDEVPLTPVEAPNDEARMMNDAAPGDSSLEDPALSTAPPARGLLGLPHGWLPILISASLFAIAHYGYGPDPIPIFILALVLGYVYQRTHRIVPCIVAHALFNSLAMVVLWWLVFRGE